MIFLVFELRDPVESATHVGVQDIRIRSGLVSLRGVLGTQENGSFVEDGRFSNYKLNLSNNDAEQIIQDLVQIFSSWGESSRDHVQRGAPIRNSRDKDLGEEDEVREE